MKTTHGVANEAAEMMPVLGQHEERTGQKPTTAVADSCYGDTANLVARAQAGIQAHVADRRSRMNIVRTKGIFPPEDFAYDAEGDTFTCPAGEQLYRHHFHARRSHWEYRTKRGVCAACPLRSQ